MSSRTQLRDSASVKGRTHIFMVALGKESEESDWFYLEWNVVGQTGDKDDYVLGDLRGAG